MADRVIVVGARRARKRVSASEICQMVGRAGRRHDGSACKATIIVDEEDEADILSEMQDEESLVVSSVMSDPETLAFHMLPEVCTGNVVDTLTAKKWYSRSFGAFQGDEPDFDKAFRVLDECRAICHPGPEVRPTSIGVLASSLYFHPGDVCGWKENFDRVFEMGLEDNDGAIAWALGSVPYMRLTGDFGKHWFAVDHCRDAIPPGLSCLSGTITTITLWLNLLGGPPVGKMRNQAKALKDDFERIRILLASLDRKVSNWDKEDFFDELGRRVKKSIPSHLVALCEIKGVTKSLAAYLHDMGVSDREGIRNVLPQIECDLDEKSMAILTEAAHGVR